MHAILIALVAAAALATSAAQASCASPQEVGRWQNTTPENGPYRLVVTLDVCDPDVQTDSPYGVRAWTRLDAGKLHGRPKVPARYVTDKGKRWMFAKVYTGGYVDHMWLRRDDQGGMPQLYVFIRHKSVDRKPDAVSRLRFTKL